MIGRKVAFFKVKTAVWWTAVFCLAWLSACQGRPMVLPVAVVEPLPTLMPTAVPLLMPATETAVPTSTATPALPPTFTPAVEELAVLAMAVPEGVMTATAVPDIATQTALRPTATPIIDRTCPQSAPLKPEYNRFYLSPLTWPTPNPVLVQPHFWLGLPLPGETLTAANLYYPYGWDGGDGRLLLHNGLDVGQPLGTPVLAAADGRVVTAGDDFSAWYGWRCDWYGHLVVIQHDQDWFGQPVYTLYGHVLNINVRVGQRVAQGEQVAEIGFGGAALAAHLHFEVRLGSNEFVNTRNPWLWLAPAAERGVIVGRLVDPENRPWQGVPLSLTNDEGEVIASTWSYLDEPLHFINPDEGLAENFVFGDILAGTYVVATRIQGVIYQQPVTVTAGEWVTVDLVTGPYQAATATAVP